MIEKLDDEKILFKENVSIMFKNVYLKRIGMYRYNNKFIYFIHFL